MFYYLSGNGSAATSLTLIQRLKQGHVYIGEKKMKNTRLLKSPEKKNTLTLNST